MELEKSKEMHDDQAREVQRAAKSLNSEFEKEKALLNQKIKFLESSL